MGSNSSATLLATNFATQRAACDEISCATSTIASAERSTSSSVVAQFTIDTRSTYDRAKLCRPATMWLRARQDRQCDRPWPEPYSDWLFHPRVSRPTLEQTWEHNAVKPPNIECDVMRPIGQWKDADLRLRVSQRRTANCRSLRSAVALRGEPIPREELVAGTVGR